MAKPVAAPSTSTTKKRSSKDSSAPSKKPSVPAPEAKAYGKKNASEKLVSISAVPIRSKGHKKRKVATEKEAVETHDEAAFEDGSEHEDEPSAGEASEDEKVLRIFSDDEDSSDEEGIDEEFSGIDVAKLPTIAKDDETVKRKLEKAKRQPVSLPVCFEIGKAQSVCHIQDGRPRRIVPWSYTPWILRDTNAILFLSVRHRNPTTIIS